MTILTVCITMLLIGGIESIDSSQFTVYLAKEKVSKGFLSSVKTVRTSPSISDFNGKVSELSNQMVTEDSLAELTQIANATLEPQALSHSYYSPVGDVTCTSLDKCQPWDPNAWKHATNDCQQTVTYTGPGLKGIPKAITVFYDIDLNGGGTEMTSSFNQIAEKYLKDHGGMDRRGKGVPPFRRGMEWCTGPGYIAFAQMAAGLVEKLFLSDINPKAVKCLHKTVKHNKLENFVEIYLGKDFTHLPVPKEEADKLDVVWGNPPNYLNIDPKSEYFKQLRPVDPGWKTHKAFYAGITPYLRQDALLLIEEVMPDKKLVTYKDLGMPLGGNYDTRPEVPLVTFRKMAGDAGLKEVGLEPLLSIYFAHASSILLFEVVPRPVVMTTSVTTQPFGWFHFSLPVVMSMLLGLTAICGVVACTVVQRKVSV